MPRPAGLGTVAAKEIGTKEIGAKESGATEIGAKEIGAKEIGRAGAKARSGIDGRGKGWPKGGQSQSSDHDGTNPWRDIL